MENQDDIMNFDIPSAKSSIIKVVGVGGGGSNAVNHMCMQGIHDVDFVVCNTDSQALSESPVQYKIQIGESLTEGRGAGGKPEIGKQAAIENLDDVMAIISEDAKMVFITSGMGGGTGTGAAPVIAEACKKAGLLTVAIVTLPFKFERRQRMEYAIAGLEELQQHVDSILVIQNEKLREVHGDLKLSSAFARADTILLQAAKGIAELITASGYINVDFNDVQTIMQESGVALMGSAVSSGEDRAIRVIEEALTSPLLNNNDITGAKKILLNITSGEDEITMEEVTHITDYVDSLIDADAMFIWGVGQDNKLKEQISVTIVATGFEEDEDLIPELRGLALGYTEPKHVISNKKSEKATEDEDSEALKISMVDIEVPTEKPEQTTFSFEDEIKESVEKNTGDNLLEFLKDAGNNTDMKKKPIHKGNIDELESVPAFQRANAKINEKVRKNSNKASRFKISDEDGKVKISKDNQYLNGNPD